MPEIRWLKATEGIHLLLTKPQNLRKLSCHFWKLALTEVRGPLCLSGTIPSAASSERAMQSCLHRLSWGSTLQRKELGCTLSCGTHDPLREGQILLSAPYWLWTDDVNKTLLQVLS